MVAAPDISPLVGKGLYTLADAAWLTGLPVGRVRRWLDGGSYVRDGRRHVRRPLLASDFGRIDGQLTLSFLNLVELLAVRECLNVPLALPEIRRAYDEAARLFQVSHPFAHEDVHLATDGKALFVRRPDGSVTRLRDGQLAFRDIVGRYLRDLEYSKKMAARWWPLGRAAGVVVDPARRFGAPIAARSGLAVRFLADVAQQLGSHERVADLYEVPVEDVRAAVDFVERFSRAA